MECTVLYCNVMSCNVMFVLMYACLYVCSMYVCMYKGTYAYELLSPWIMVRVFLGFASEFSGSGQQVQLWSLERVQASLSVP